MAEWMLEKSNWKFWKKFVNSHIPEKKNPSTFSFVDRKHEGNNSRDILARARPSVQCRFPTWNTQHSENCHRWSRQIRQSMNHSAWSPFPCFSSNIHKLKWGNPHSGSYTPTPTTLFFLIIMLSISSIFLRNSGFGSVISLRTCKYNLPYKFSKTNIIVQLFWYWF